MTEDKIVGWHHRLNGHEFEQAPGDGEGQGGLACCRPQGAKSRTRLSSRTTTRQHQGAWTLSSDRFLQVLSVCEQ